MTVLKYSFGLFHHKSVKSRNEPLINPRGRPKTLGEWGEWTRGEMTTSEFLGIMRQRWYVVLAGLVIVAGSIAYVSSRAGVYWTQVDVVVLAPKSARYPNVIRDTSQSLISMAGLIERDLNKGITPPATASSSVTLVNEGVSEGYSISLPNSGGQWANNFDRAVLDVQVVGPSAEKVRVELRELVAMIDNNLKQRQVADGVDNRDFITTSSAPSAAALFYFNGERSHAFAAILLLGGTLIPVSSVGADRLLRANARRRRKSVIISRAGVPV